MATGLTIIYDALKEIGVLAEGDTPSGSMANDALRALNRICEKLSNDQSFSPYANHETWALTGESSFTIGPTGQLVTVRPIKIDTCTVDRNGITYPVEVVDNQKWDSIVFKAAAGANTTTLYYESTSPNAIIHVWPLATGCTLNMRVISQILSFPQLTTTLIMPPGYEEACIKLLAVNLAPQYPAGVLQPGTIIAAKSALKYIQKINNVIPTMRLPTTLTSNWRGGSLANFLGGY